MLVDHAGAVAFFGVRGYSGFRVISVPIARQMSAHYHIRWSSSKVDWQAFCTEEEAKTEAERLKGPQETYVIEGSEDGECVRCNEIRLNS